MGFSLSNLLATAGDVFGATIGDPALGHQVLGVYNAVTGSGSEQQAQTQAQQAGDPFSAYRPGLAASYNKALTSGNQLDPTQMPGYSQWMSGVLNPAMSAVQGKMSAAGLSMSGAETDALLGTAQQGYYGFMTDYLNRLAQGSGAVNNPVQAAGLGLSQGNLQGQAIAQGAGGLASAAPGLISAYNNWMNPTGQGSVSGGYTGIDGSRVNNPSAWDAGSYSSSDWNAYDPGISVPG